MTLEKHPANKDFIWSIPKGPYKYLKDHEVQHFNEKGYLLVKDAFDSSLMDKITSIIDPFELKVTDALTKLDGEKFFISRAKEITFSPHLVTLSEELKKFSKHNIFLSLCLDLIGNNVRLYWDQAVYKKPDTKDEFPWHQDNGYTYINPQAYLTCWVALTDTDESNGCPWVVPGMHTMGTLNHKVTDLGYEIPLDSSDAVPLELSSGSIAIFSSLTPHRTGPNATDKVRKGYILQYAPDGAERRISNSLYEKVNDENRQFFVVEKGKFIN